MKKHNNKFVYYKDNRTGKVMNMNHWEWEIIQNDSNNRHLKEVFEFIRLVDLSSPVNSRPEKLQVIDDPLECPICGFIAETEERLQLHKKDIHS